MKNAQVVVIDDSTESLRVAARILSELRAENPILFKDVKRALQYLEGVVAGEDPCPDLLVLDLDFGMDSGFEVLRFYKTYPKLAQCKIVVWTQFAESQQELCRLFGIDHVVPKDRGERKLLEVLTEVTKPFTQSAGSY